MKDVIDASGIHSPADSHFNHLLVNQVLKQINRSSSKTSTRGRVTDDKQSYKINITAAMMRSPNSNTSLPFEKEKYINMLYSRTSLSRSSARRLVMKAHHQREKLTTEEMDITWSIISHRNKYNTKQKFISSLLLEWIINHPHVVSSPFMNDTVLVKVHLPNGETTKERVGKLLIEISIRELHLDMMKPPPIGLSEVYCKDTQNLIVSERHLRSILPPQLRPITFSQKQLCGCECCTVMKMLHTSLVKSRKAAINTQSNQTRFTRRIQHLIDPMLMYSNTLNLNDNYLSYDIREQFLSMTCPRTSDSALLKWKCVMNRCMSCPDIKLPPEETSSNSVLNKISYATYNFQVKCKLHGLLSRNSSFCQKCKVIAEGNQLFIPEKIIKKKEIAILETSIDKFHKEIYIPTLSQYRYHIALVIILSKNHCKKSRFEAFSSNSSWFFLNVTMLSA